MKTKILILTVILLTSVSCDNSRIKENQEQATPEALQDESKYDLTSKRSYDGMLKNLYAELVTNTPELKELENKLDTLYASKEDSTKSFDEYNRKSQSYYSSADSHIKEINDSTLRKKMKALISSSLTKYNSKISQHSEILKSIDKKTMTLNDLHEILIITRTLPLIEKYQNDNLPSTKPLNGYLRQLDNVTQTQNSLLENTNKKEKKE